MTPSLSVFIPSLGSKGPTVSPMMAYCTMCAMINPCTTSRIVARFQPMCDMGGDFPDDFPEVLSTVSEISEEGLRSSLRG